MEKERVICRKVPDGVFLYIAHTFDLKQIAESGQCFRLTALDDGYIAVTGTKMVKITHCAEGGYIFHCSYDDFLKVWVPYFDLAADYEEYQQRMAEDPFLQKAIAAGGGIRILRQDFWEALVTFTISQRNNIPRIRKSVDILCELYGTPLGEIDGHMVYSFPTPEQLNGRDLSPASLGYRKTYIEDLAAYGSEYWETMKHYNDDATLKMLTGIRGIGEKVANCVMLFGLHRMSSYPRDVWINRMIDDIYHGEFDPSIYAGFAGYVQQLQFFYYRQIAKGEDDE